MRNINCKIHKNYINFIEYPYKCSAAYRNKKIEASEIIEAMEFFCLNTIRTIDGELIMIPKPKESKNPLLVFCRENDISVKKRKDIWGMILEPFLDTEHSQEYIERTYTTLEKHGIDRKECNALRQEVSERMIAYNFESCLWEWVRLGLYDVLNASCGILSGEKHRLSDTDFETFYKKAMVIALKGFE